MRHPYLWLLAVTACAAAPPAPVPPPVARASVAGPAPTAAEAAAPAEPRGLRALAIPAAVCELTGPVVNEVALASSSGGEPFAVISGGTGTLGIDQQGGPYLRVQSPTGVVLQGFAAWRTLPAQENALVVYAKRWLAFGGVYFAGIGEPLVVHGVRDGKLLVSPSSEMTGVSSLDRPGGLSAGFQLLEASRTLEVPCADLSLAPDPSGPQRTTLPEPFRPAGANKPKQMWLAPVTTVPISPASDGAPGGNLETSNPTRLVVLERRAARARVRFGHVAGWIDAKLLHATLPKSSPRGRPELFGMLGLLDTGTPGNVLDQGLRAGERALSCPKAVRLVAEPTAGESPLRLIVGSIPAAHDFIVPAASSGELTELLPRGTVRRGSVNLAVPAADLAGCEEVRSAHHPAFLPAGQPPELLVDAIDALDEPPAPSDQLSALGQMEISDPEAGMRLGQSGRPTGPRIRFERLQVKGRLPPEVISRIVRQNHARFRRCYERGLARDPALKGRVSVAFSIDKSGALSLATNQGSQLADTGVIACVVQAFNGLTFPEPEGGVVQVLFPMTFDPQ